MIKKVGVIDYGMSNLLSLQRALEHVGAEVEVLSETRSLLDFDKIFLPGVGAFPDGMRNLKSLGFDEVIREYVGEGKHFFGICLGMQMMLGEGLEMEKTEGLGLVDGVCRPLPDTDMHGKRNIIPHVGWEEVFNKNGFSGTPLRATREGTHCYFVHSYFADLGDEKNAMCYSKFGDIDFVSGIKKGNCFGVQFHPEKSGEDGLRILKEFLDLGST